MFIPVTTQLGDVSVTCTITNSGTLVAECDVEHDGMQYLPGAPVEVKFGDEIKLKANVVSDSQFKVEVEGVEFTWYIRRTLPIPYIEGVGQQLIVGEILDGIRHEDGNFVELQEGDPLTGEPTVFYNDFVGNAVLVVNVITGKYKSLPVDGELVSATALPGPRAKFASEGYLVILHNVEETPRARFDVYDSQLNLIRANWFTDSGSARGTAIEAVDQDSFVLMVNNSVSYLVGMNGTYSNLGISATGVMVDSSSIYLYTNNGVELRGDSTSGSITHPIPTLAITPIFSGSVKHDSYIYTINQANSTLSRNVKRSTATAEYIALKAVPAMVVVTSEDTPRVVVSYFDDPVADIFDEDLNPIGTIEVGRSAQLSEIDGKIISTLVYSDAPTISKIAKTQTFNVVHDAYQELNKELRITYQHSFDLPVPVELLNPETNVLVNGTSFTGGILPASATLTFIIPPTPDYHRYMTVGLVGTATVVMNVLSTPRLFPELHRPATVYEAILRSEYLDTYQIRGLTEGFTTTLVSQSRAVTLSVNGGPFESEVEVKEFDEVTVRFYISRFADAGPTRNTVLTYGGRDAVLWDVIVMTLDGVTMSRASTKTKHKLFEHFEGDYLQKITADVVQGPHEEVYSVRLEADVDASYYLHASTYDHGMMPASACYNGNPLHDVKAEPVYWAFTSEGDALNMGKVFDIAQQGGLQGSSSFSVHDFGYKLSAAAVVSTHTSEYRLRTSAVNHTYSLNHALHVGSAFSEHGTQHEVRTGYAIFEFSNVYDIRPSADIYALSAGHQAHAPVTPSSIDIGWGVRLGTHIETSGAESGVRSYPSAFLLTPEHTHHILTGFVSAEPEHWVQTETSRITLGIDYSVLAPTANADVNTEHGALVKTHMELVDTGVAVSRFGERSAFRYKRQAISAESKTFELDTVHAVDVSAKRVSLSQTSESQKPLKYNVVDMEFERIRRAGQIASSVDVSLRPGTSTAAHTATAEFRVSNYSLGVVAEDDGLFATYEAASEYAQGLGVDESLLDISQEGSVWVVRVRPYDLLIQCVESDVDIENKVFGFLHGG